VCVCLCVCARSMVNAISSTNLMVCEALSGVCIPAEKTQVLLINR
jgi:hypothetical protein